MHRRGHPCCGPRLPMVALRWSDPHLLSKHPTRANFPQNDGYCQESLETNQLVFVPWDWVGSWAIPVFQQLTVDNTPHLRSMERIRIDVMVNISPSHWEFSCPQGWNWTSILSQCILHLCWNIMITIQNPLLVSRKSFQLRMIPSQSIDVPCKS